ncbi:hypothetical protein RHSIM_Rhsim02G0123100 [Rhododendron simsii]|uniref:TIR domain-containing protein n=1 Tax=Rhododendron simsii TaxID=118357 RepID=A0A834HBY1_RHOSS|nr:hypothetical protein RHSIM_Rhsim02G0123100 [Rhododendron simsii]
MQRSSSTAKNLCRQIFRDGKPLEYPKHCDVFISHRRIDTYRNVAGLLYNHLSRLNLRPFLDSKSMKPGDKLFEKIDAAIRDCQLHMMMECKKKVIPIFVNVKPSELRVSDCRSCPAEELFRLREAIEEAKNTVGLTFDTSNGDWSELLKDTSDAVMGNLLQLEGEIIGRKQKYIDY